MFKHWWFTLPLLALIMLMAGCSGEKQVTDPPTISDEGIGPVAQSNPAQWPTSMSHFKFPFSGPMDDYWHGEVWKIACGYGCYKHVNWSYPAAGYYSVDLVRDDGGSTTGSWVLAPARGVVVFCGQMTGYGHCVVMDHGNGWKSIVAHLACDPNNFTHVGHDLLQGTLIGIAGSSGTTSPHIHFGIWRNNVPVSLEGISGGAHIAPYGRYCSGNAYVQSPTGRTICPQ